MPPKKKQRVAPPQERFKALKIVIIDALPFQRKLWQERIGPGFVAVTSADVAAGALARHGDATHVVSCAKDRALAGRVRDDVGAAPHVVTDEWLTTTLRAADGLAAEADFAWRAPAPAAPAAAAPAAARARAVNVDAGQNDDVVAKLKELLAFYEADGESNFRTMPLKKAISRLATLPALAEGDLDDASLAALLPKACQANTRAKIVEIFETGDLERLVEFRGNPDKRARKELTTVFGVQTATANQLIQQGVRSVADLRAAVAARPNLVPARTVAALAVHEDLQTRMPRAECARIRDEIAQKARAIFARRYPRADPFELSVEASGSFRRGAATCGDVDVLVTAPVWRDGDAGDDGGARRASDDAGDPDVGAAESRSSRDAFLRDLVGALHGSGLLTAHLAGACLGGGAADGPVEVDDVGKVLRAGPSTYNGIGRVDGGAHRRVDIKCYAPQHYAFALVYFSSGDHFNRAIRSLAKAQGYSLCDTGLRASARSGSCYGGDGKYVSNKIQVCRSVPCATEADIFAFLGIDYKSPEERAVADNATAVGSRARAIRLGAGLAADSDDDDGAA